MVLRWLVRSFSEVREELSGSASQTALAQTENVGRDAAYAVLSLMPLPPSAVLSWCALLQAPCGLCGLLPHAALLVRGFLWCR